jgi:hypothetical protein
LGKVQLSASDDERRRNWRVLGFVPCPADQVKAKKRRIIFINKIINDEVAFQVSDLTVKSIQKIDTNVTPEKRLHDAKPANL